MEVNFRAIEKYTAQRLKTRKKPATTNRELELLRRALRLAHKRKLLPTITEVEMLPEFNARQGVFERADFEVVVGALPAYLQDFTRFGFITAMRKGEIASLLWKDVDRTGGVIRLLDAKAKTGEGRSIVLEGDLVDIIERRWQDQLFTRVSGEPFTSQYVFHRQGRPIGDFRKAWATACTTAGVPERTFHDLRRTAITNMDRGGVPRTVAMAISGHKTEATYLRYRIINEGDLRKAARQTQMYIDTLPTERSAHADAGLSPPRSG